jgi:rod shape determining protein RodA
MSYGYGPAVSTRHTVKPGGRSGSGIAAYLRGLDWVLAGSALILSFVGALLVWSATKSRMIGFGNDPQTYFKRHLLNMVIGIVLAIFASRANYRLLRAYTPILYLICVLGLVLVLVPHVGENVNGARAWIPLPAGFSIQPAEFAKVGIILAMAMILAEKRDAEVEPKNANVTQARCWSQPVEC